MPAEDQIRYPKPPQGFAVSHLYISILVIPSQSSQDEGNAIPDNGIGCPCHTDEPYTTDWAQDSAPMLPPPSAKDPFARKFVRDLISSSDYKPEAPIIVLDKAISRGNLPNTPEARATLWKEMGLED